LVKSVNAELKEQPKSFKIQAFIVTSPSILHTAYSIDIIIYAHLSVEALFFTWSAHELVEVSYKYWLHRLHAAYAWYLLCTLDEGKWRRNAQVED